MAASESTKLQVNFKTRGGALVNLYAATAEELDEGLATFTDRIQSILEVESLLSGASVVQAAVAAPNEPTNVTALPTPSQVGADENTTCKHGPRAYRSGNKNGKKWEAWFCGAPKGAPDQCSPAWA